MNRAWKSDRLGLFCLVWFFFPSQFRLIVKFRIVSLRLDSCGVDTWAVQSQWHCTTNLATVAHLSFKEREKKVSQSGCVFAVMRRSRKVRVWEELHAEAVHERTRMEQHPLPVKKRWHGARGVGWGTALGNNPVLKVRADTQWKMFSKKRRELIKTHSVSKKSRTGNPSPHSSSTVSRALSSPVTQPHTSLLTSVGN